MINALQQKGGNLKMITLNFQDFNQFYQPEINFSVSFPGMCFGKSLVFNLHIR